MRNDSWTAALASLPTGEATASTCSESFEPKLKPTRGHKACITELSLRFPCPRDTDPEAYQRRLDYLADDTCHLAVPLLRAACDRAAQSARGLPYASEIINQATAIVEERQRQADRASNPMGGQASAPDSRTAAYYAGNVAALQRGGKCMMTGAGEMFKLGDLGERRGVRYDGSIIEPWFHHKADDSDPIAQGWWCKQEDARMLAESYSNSNAPYRMAGCMVTEHD